jgi:hypothetical protein
MLRLRSHRLGRLAPVALGAALLISACSTTGKASIATTDTTAAPNVTTTTERATTTERPTTTERASTTAATTTTTRPAPTTTERRDDSVLYTSLVAALLNSDKWFAFSMPSSECAAPKAVAIIGVDRLDAVGFSAIVSDPGKILTLVDRGRAEQIIAAIRACGGDVRASSAHVLVRSVDIPLNEECIVNHLSEDGANLVFYASIMDNDISQTEIRNVIGDSLSSCRA